MNLTTLGWKPCYEEYYKPYREQGYFVGRVGEEQKETYRIFTETGEVLAQISGKMRFGASGRGDYPAVGDWVVINYAAGDDRAIIQAILPRESKFSRKAVGEATREQIVATNIDTVFLVNSLNNDFNLRRIERYITLTWESGANPVVVLSKADLCAESGQRVAEVERIALGVSVYPISSVTGAGLSELMAYFGAGRTVALLGSSGAGKSTLINRLIGEDIQKVKEVRQGDDRGRHTTTHRELIMLPQGGMIIDTPGMRELQLWGTEEGLRDTFDDVEQLALRCKFVDCEHDLEPGCAVQAGLQNGDLDQARFANYLKLRRELAYLARKESKLEQLVEKEKWKKIHKALKTQKHR